MIDLPAIRERAAAFEAARESRTCHNWKAVTLNTQGAQLKLAVFRLDSDSRGVLTHNGYWYEPDVRFVELCDSTQLAADVRGLCERVEELERRITDARLPKEPQ